MAQLSASFVSALRSRPELRRRLLAGAVALLALLAAIWLWDAVRQADRLRNAEELGRAGQYAAALAAAAGVTDAPALADALALRAHALEDLGLVGQASAAYATAVKRSPSDWRLRYDWAILLLHIGQPLAARAEMREALRLNPRVALPPGFTRAGLAAR